MCFTVPEVTLEAYMVLIRQMMAWTTQLFHVWKLLYGIRHLQVFAAQVHSISSQNLVLHSKIRISWTERPHER